MQKIYPEIIEYISDRISEFYEIEDKRKEILRSIRNYIKDGAAKGDTSDMIFICTHNSRRSHFAQIWSQIASHYYNTRNFRSYSGGTESTSLNPSVVRALESSGIRIKTFEENENPRYYISYAENTDNIVGYSKHYSDNENHQTNFAAVMVCSDAEERCPLVLGADKRFYLPYADPKSADGTPEESKVYEESCKLIAREMCFVFSKK